LNDKQKTELYAAKRYISFLGYPFSDNDFCFPEECSPIDVLFKPKNIKMQVTSYDGGPNKLHKNGEYSWSVSLNEVAKLYIEPIFKKFKCYGGGSAIFDTVLLINLTKKIGLNDTFEKSIDLNREIILDISKKSGFKSIYLVFDFKGEILPIYVRKDDNEN
jgi:hypothetical protein